MVPQTSVKVLVTAPTRIFRLVPSYQMSPSFGDVGAVPERRRSVALVAVDAGASRAAVGVDVPMPRLPAFVNAMLVIARLPETLTPEVRAKAREKASLGEVFGGGRAPTIIIVLLSQLSGITGFSVMTALFAIFCKKRYGYDAAHVGYVLAYVGILGALMQGGVLRRLLRKPIEKPLAIIGTAVLAVSMGALAFLPIGSGLGLLLLVCTGISVGNSLSTPTLNGLASRAVDAHAQGRLMGLMQSAGGMGRFLGPVLGYSLVEYDGANAYGYWAFIASAGLLALDCVLLCALRVPRPPVEEAV